MMKRYWLNRVKSSSLGLVAGVTLLVAGLPSPASAQIVQVSRGDARNSVGFNFGYFVVRGEDVRIDDDVLLANLDDLAFEIGDFSGFSFGGEWLYGIGRLHRDRRRRRLLPERPCQACIATSSTSTAPRLCRT